MKKTQLLVYFTWYCGGNVSLYLTKLQNATESLFLVQSVFNILSRTLAQNGCISPLLIKHKQFMRSIQLVTKQDLQLK